MIKRLFFAAACYLAFTSYMNAEVVLANFDDVLDASALSIEPEANNTACTISVANNPDQSGINATDQCMYFKQENDQVNNSRAVITLSNAIQITEENRYLHIMAYMDIAQTDCGIKNDGNTDFTWLGDKNMGRIIPGKTNEWVDIVYDMKSSNVSSVITTIKAIAFSEWGIGNSNMYFDEIVLNNDPNPRGETIIETATTIADFNDGTFAGNMASTGNGASTIEITDNPLASGINQSAKALHVQINSTGEWWGGVDIDLPSKCRITDANRYMHIMYYIPNALTKIEFIINNTGENWTGAMNSPTTGQWVDYVIDLHNFNNNNLQGTTVQRFRLVTFPNETGNQNKDIYLDEIILNNDPNARTVSQGTGLQQVQASNAVRTIDGGIALCGIRGNVKIFDATGRTVANTYLENDMELTLNKGIYVVVAADIKTKVIVK